jgi:hypothetical protein
MPADLLSLYARHDGYCSDKWEANLKRYEALFAPLRGEPIRFLEVGVQNGGSLEIWARFFAAAKVIVGCDVDPRCAALAFADSRIRLAIGDILCEETLSRILTASGEFDVIIDDGSHRPNDVAGTFCSLFPALADGGFYVIEDLHCSYWGEFQGGLFAPHSAMSFLKGLCDVVNYPHWGIPGAAGLALNEAFREHAARLPPEQLEHIHSIEFTNSLCIIRKDRPDRNALGRRIIAGSRADVFPVLKLSAEKSVAPDQALNPWSKPPRPAAEGQGAEAVTVSERCPREVDALEAQIAEMRAGIAGLQDELAAIKRLWSWRLMGPFRNLWRLPGRVRRQLLRRFRP